MFQASGVVIHPGRVETTTGTYDLRAVDGVETGAIVVSTRAVVSGIAGAVAFAAGWAALFGLEQGAWAFCGGIIAERIRGWWAGQKHGAYILMRGMRVQLATGDAASMKQVAAAVLAAAGSAR